MDKLAIHGGTPVRTAPFPHWPVWGKEEEQALLEVLHSGRWGIGGDKVAEFEAAFARFQDARYGVCVTNGTAALEIALRAAGVAVAMMPSRFLTEAIAEEVPVAAGDRVLLPRTEAAPPGLAQALRRRGAVVDEVVAYRTVIAPPRSRPRLHAAIRRGVDAVVLTSPSTVHGLVRLLGDRRGALGRAAIACIGPVTATAAIEEGLRPAVVAGEHTVDGLLDALVAHYTARPRGGSHARDRAAR
ncbi:MAG: uroporphyrinogen-III synthase [Armatimonadota bacterium]|nr:uroporphyrinogen-III synthase [Armatimonadota bacterium]